MVHANPVDPWRPFRVAAARRLGSALRRRGATVTDEEVQEELAHPTTVSADLALAVHRYASAAQTPPDQLARALAADLAAGDGIESVVAQGGYVNLSIDFATLARATLEGALQMGAAYGAGPPRPASVCVEHTSANPTGPFHIGRVRNAVIGDTLARVLRLAGFEATTQYYVDDVGRAAAIMTWLWGRPTAEWPPEIRAALPPDGTPEPGEKADHFLGRPYPAANQYLKDHEDAREAVTALGRALESGHAPPQHREILEKVLAGMLESLARIHVEFDEFVWESLFLSDGSVDQVVARLRSSPHAAIEPNGALAIDASGRGLPVEEERIIVTRADRTTLYATRDVAYHLSKFGRFARVLDVLGADHLLHARTLEVLLDEIGESRRPEFVHYQYITTAEGSKMSTRAGTAVHLDEILMEGVARARDEVRFRRPELDPTEVDRIAERVASGAVRYLIARVAPDKSIKFRWDEALSFEGRSGPFVQYAYARASSVLRKGELPTESLDFPFDPQALTTEEERRLVRVVARWPGVVDYAARTAHVHAVATYAHDLADAFNSFYQRVPILMSPDAVRPTRVALLAATRRTLANVLGALGIGALESM